MTTNPASDDPLDDEPTRSLREAVGERFTRLTRLGTGTFGEVWLGEQVGLRRKVAIKTLRPAASLYGQAERLLALRAEAMTLATLKHPHVVQVFDWVDSADGPCVLMEYAPGGSFKERGRLGWEEAARHVADAAEGLVAVHARGIVHRDIKPANLLWHNADGRDDALLADFGLAARLGERTRPAGTVAFMAPEVLLGAAPDPSQDVFGLAATLFWMLTGAVPFPLPVGTGGETPPLERLRAEFLPLIARGLPAEDPRLSCVPAGVEGVVHAGLAARPEDRPTPALFATHLRGALNQSLSDSVPAAVPGGRGLTIEVLRQEGSSLRPVARTRPSVGLRKMVPAAPERAGVRTGDVVRVEVVAGRDGFLTVFNVDSEGGINPLCPPVAGAAPVPVRAGVPLRVVDVRMEPPPGPERVFAIWTPTPTPPDLSTALRRADSLKEAPSPAALASRKMVAVREWVATQPEGECEVGVLEIDHR